MNLGLFEDNGWRNLLPLTYLRACFELRCGRDRLCDKVRSQFDRPIAGVWLREDISAVVSRRIELADPVHGEDWCLVNSRALVTARLSPPAVGEAWFSGDEFLAVGVAADQINSMTADSFAVTESLRRVEPPDGIRLIRYAWELPLINGDELRRQCTEGGAAWN